MASDTTFVGAEAGKAQILVFANQGVYKYLGSSADWCSTVGRPGEYTVDTLDVEYEALPDGVEWRDAHVSVTDSVQTLTLVIRQSRQTTTGLTSVGSARQSATFEVFDLQGRRIGDGRQAKGIYLERKNGQVRKMMGR